MPVVEAVILTAGQRAAVVGMTRPQSWVQIDPRTIDAVSPGSVTNTNPNAAGVAVGASVSLTGMFIVNVGLLVDQFWKNSSVTNFLSTRPWGLIDSSIVFLP